MAGMRRAERAEETRAKLIAAARKAFAAKGYAAASMDDLTADAGLTRGALYHAFGDKKAARARFYVAGTLVRDLNLGTWANDTVLGAIVAWDASSASGQLDGIATVTSSVAVDYDGAEVAYLRVGGSLAEGSEWGGTVSRFDHRPVRVADAGLQAIVAV